MSSWAVFPSNTTTTCSADRTAGGSLPAHERVFVYRCPQCGKLEFFAHDTDHDMKNQEMACFECGGPIGPGESRCARCGWSWKGGGELSDNSL
jgi:DNA-directed RNA polymerase subunit RPC12/RpoP